MKRRKRIFVITATCLAAIIAFTISASARQWFNKDRNSIWNIRNELGSTVNNVIVEGMMTTWNDVRDVNGNQFYRFSRTTSSSPDGTLLFTQFGPRDEGVGRIRVTNHPTNIPIRVIYVSIELNSAFTWSTSASPPATAYHAPSVILHELGHVIGIQHCCSLPNCNSIMNDNINKGVVRITPQTKDINAKRALP
jgi:hypothetical protein